MICNRKLNFDSSTQDVAPPPDSQRPYVLPLHLRPDLVVPCADLVNCEWPRSRTARVHALNKSRLQFPVCLVLLCGHQQTEQLLGHARLSRVVGHEGSLFVESVVVSRAQRGRGYGRTLMEETERYARSRGFTRLCLTTHDKQHFYAHLGYQLTTPVQNAGAMTTFVTLETLLRLSGQSVLDNKAPPSIPQAPPPPAVLQAPPPPSIPQAPPPPAVLQAPPPPSVVVQTLNQTPYRDAKGLTIYWMHKNI
uniref:N-acetyltransferase domain-containing protein n=1 Tax=Gouania willdenowi TaxID=441366 RepID=A0A8C5DBR6_GOUWI